MCRDDRGSVFRPTSIETVPKGHEMDGVLLHRLEALDLARSEHHEDVVREDRRVVVRAVRLGYRVSQIPVAMRLRQTGTPSQSPFKAMLYLGRAFLTLLLALVRR